MIFDVFISHSTADRLVADAICHKLEERGVRCWMAPRDVAPGDTWAGAIVRAIGASRLMVFIFSNESNTSKYCHRELELAVQKGVAIIPFRIEDDDPTDEMQFFLSSTMFLDALTSDTDAHVAQLVMRVEGVLVERWPVAVQGDRGSGVRDDDLAPVPRDLDGDHRAPEARNRAIRDRTLAARLCVTNIGANAPTMDAWLDAEAQTATAQAASDDERFAEAMGYWEQALKSYVWAIERSGFLNQSPPISRMSVGGRFVWALARREARGLGSAEVHPEHVMIGLCKAADVGSDPARFDMSDLEPDDAGALVAEMTALSAALESAGVIVTRVRRRLRAVWREDRQVSEEFTGHRTPECRQVFDLAGSLTHDAIDGIALTRALLVLAGPLLDRPLAETKTTRVDVARALLAHTLGSRDAGGDGDRTTASLPAPHTTQAEAGVTSSSGVRAVLALGAIEARRLGSRDIDAEHLFLGMWKLESLADFADARNSEPVEPRVPELRSEASVITSLFDRAEVDVKRARRRLRALWLESHPTQQEFSGHRSERSRQVFRAAGQAGAGRIGVVALMNAMLAVDAPLVDRLMVELGVNRDRLILVFREARAREP